VEHEVELLEASQEGLSVGEKAPERAEVPREAVEVEGSTAARLAALRVDFSVAAEVATGEGLLAAPRAESVGAR
jgi:hypothetical protein